MAHHKKRGKGCGCLMCKPNKMRGWNKRFVLGFRGFGKIRRETAARDELKLS